MPNADINAVLKELGAVEANVEKIDRILDEIEQLPSEAIKSSSDPVYEDRLRAFDEVLRALPSISGWKPITKPAAWSSLGMLPVRSEKEKKSPFNAAVAAPRRELNEYRHRLNRERRRAIRDTLQKVISAVDATVQTLQQQDDPERAANETFDGEVWEKLKKLVEMIGVLLGSSLARPPRWSDLRRHLSFAMVQDARDIIRLDWPDVKSGLTHTLYDDDEPVPVTVSDLKDLTQSQVSGEVVTELNWKSLNDRDFERLIFSLVVFSPGYENPQWLTNTNASDKGRDLSVDQVTIDHLVGVTRRRVVIQCKHWLSKTIGVSEIATLLAQMRLHEPPTVDVLIIATSGRFSADAVAYIERQNASDTALRIIPWPDSHLELLLAQRPALVAEFKLR